MSSQAPSAPSVPLRQRSQFEQPDGPSPAVRPRPRSGLVPLSILVLLASEIPLIGVSLFAALLTLGGDPVVFFADDNGFFRLLFLTFTILFGMHLNDLYSQVRIESRLKLVLQILQSMGLACIGQAVISYANVDLLTPRPLVFLGTAFSTFVILLWRFLFSKYALRIMGEQRVLFVGETPLTRGVAAQIATHPQLRLSVAGYIDDFHQTVRRSDDGRLLGPSSRLSEMVNQSHPDRIVVDSAKCRGDFAAEVLGLRARGYTVEDAAILYEQVCRRVYTAESQTRPGTDSQFRETAKSRLPGPGNFLIAAVACAVTAPLLAILGAVVRLSSPGPVLYRQTRTGLHGKPFTIYKFRSMYQDAEIRTGPVWAIRNDPRITPVGRILRKTRLDELPQLFNVLRGDMALVGPRPERPEFVQELSGKIPFYAGRHAVKPGITGWAQINFKYGNSVEDVVTKLGYDLYYIKHQSFSLDFYILFQTLKTILLTRGAQ